MADSVENRPNISDLMRISQRHLARKAEIALQRMGDPRQRVDIIPGKPAQLVPLSEKGE